MEVSVRPDGRDCDRDARKVLIGATPRRRAWGMRSFLRE
jgi:hypothetical protein